jgi:hypothetical protein
MYVGYNTDWSGVSRASHRYSSYNLSLGSLTWSTYAYGMMLLLESSTCPMCMPIAICKNRQFNSCMFMIISDCYIIKQHVSHAWYECWTMKTLVEAEML